MAAGAANRCSRGDVEMVSPVRAAGRLGLRSTSTPAKRHGASPVKQRHQPVGEHRAPMDIVMTAADLAIGDVIALREKDVAEMAVAHQVSFIEHHFVERTVGSGHVVVPANLQVEANLFAWGGDEARAAAFGSSWPAGSRNDPDCDSTLPKTSGWANAISAAASPPTL